ncbi:3-oxoacyl-ACP synthase, partial [bacterium]|nr:3-oxoacyl-ACP synthase [bacterium]
RSICVLFGDGAGAVVVGEVLPEYGIVRSDLNSDGAQASILMVKGGGTKYPIGPAVLESKSHFIYMDGKAVFKVAVNTIVSALSESLEKAGLLPKDIDLLIPHQANYRIIDYIREKLGLSESQVYSNVHRYGNTSAASIPIAIAEAVEEGRLKSGNLLVTIGFGAGFTWATTIIRWGGH